MDKLPSSINPSSSAYTRSPLAMSDILNQQLLNLSQTLLSLNKIVQDFSLGISRSTYDLNTQIQSIQTALNQIAQQQSGYASSALNVPINITQPTATVVDITEAKAKKADAPGKRGKKSNAAKAAETAAINEHCLSQINNLPEKELIAALQNNKIRPELVDEILQKRPLANIEDLLSIEGLGAGRFERIKMIWQPE